MDIKFATLSTDTKKLLRKAGFSSVREVLKTTPAQLAKELTLDLPATLRLIEELSGKSQDAIKGTNALDMIKSLETSGTRHVTTMCRDLDSILKGGFPVGTVSELCGAPGAGKTQVCMQVAVSACIPEDFSGLAGHTLYLDTEGSFSVGRAREMAEALSSHLKRMADGECAVPSVDDILSSIHICRAYDAGEQLAFVQHLPQYLKENPKIRLIVIDSVAHHFRHDITDVSHRGKVLARMAQLLNTVACDHGIVVLVTNHMTTRSDQVLVPALGEHWYHGVTNRIILTKSETMVEWKHPRRTDEVPPAIVPVRRAEIIKASALQQAGADFLVVSIGIRAVPGKKKAEQQHQPAKEAVTEALKRVKTSL